jgi:GxxExxY protein
MEIIMIEENKELTGKILQACIEVHRHMGPGLLEKVYEHCLLKEFQLQNIKAQAQVEIPLVYKGFELGKSYTVDILVEDQVVLELKAIEQVHPVYESQLISYLKLSGKKIGFLVNFNVPLMKQGIKRFVNSATSAPPQQRSSDYNSSK